ncbi:MAG: hypothetical protein CEN89_569 [Candidatus Berkelbacteria bacterium Licking1014_7]|uniref:Small ribosomal subunit protein bS21 n=1 Tax=Candidatus Berkelbacteria bacterium Licking1014_7 TaxID=2017147 RepID=A0A554LJ21_9BACT|nr:MAG: hypothetical protein CEN89_569 [Candidatus Berkelbacteria bacterium Licking1014_7]
MIIISIRAKKQESFDVMLRRFNRDVQQAGILTEVKNRRFFSRKPSKNLRRQEAQRLEENRKRKRGY